MFDDSENGPPGEGAPGVIRRIARGTAAGVPVIGGLLAEIVDSVLKPTVERQSNEFLKDLSSGLEELRERTRISIEDLKSNPDFTNAVFRAARTAATTASEEKRTALRNAVLNVALKHAPEADLQQLFLRYVDELVSTHLKLLKIIGEPGMIDNTTGGGVEKMPLADFFPGDAKGPAADRFVQDLIDRGLVILEPIRPNPFPTPQPLVRHSKYDFKITPLGKLFLEFVTAPPELGPPT